MIQTHLLPVQRDEKGAFVIHPGTGRRIDRPAGRQPHTVRFYQILPPVRINTAVPTKEGGR